MFPFRASPGRLRVGAGGLKSVEEAGKVKDRDGAHQEEELGALAVCENPFLFFADSLSQ